MKFPYPVMYKNIYKYDDMKRSEHMAVRNSVGWYLWTHQIVEVTGEDATAFMEYIFPKNIGTLAIGRERYTPVLDEKAEIIDDTVVFRMGENDYWISTLFKVDLMKWLEQNKGDYQAEWRDLTGKWEMYAVQGPRSMDIINALVTTPVDDQKFFEIRANSIDGEAVYINRAGFTGEKIGYEIYIAPKKASELEGKLRKLCEDAGGREVTEFQIMAWTLPTEAGFYYMRDLRHVNPYEVEQEKGINFEKEFIGKAALEQIRDNGAEREVVGFTVEEADIHIKGRHLGNEGEEVYKNGEFVGRCMKIVYSYVKEMNNGFIICKKGSLKNGDVVTMHGHEAVICDKNFLG